MLASLTGSAASAAAAGDDSAAKMFSFNAFGTFGVVHSSEDQADFTSSRFKPNGAGYSHNWSSDVDTRFGAQVTANFTSKLSAVLQVVAEQSYDNTYAPVIEWANVKYEFTRDFYIRVGRILGPGFLVSDTLKVGYANPWVRPPTEVYTLNPISNNDGVDASYRVHLGAATNTTQALYSNKLRDKFPSNYISTARNYWGIFDRLEYRAALVSVSYTQASINLQPSLPLFDAFRQFGPQGSAIADRFELVDKPAPTLTFGASYDPGRWFAMTEWTRVNTHSFIGVNTGWYVSGGYRVGQFTPYITYADLTTRTRSDPGLNLASVPTSEAGTVAALNAGLNFALGTLPVQNTVSVGSRWDFAKNVALKMQLDHSEFGPGSPGTLINLQPGFKFGGAVNLYSVSIDFVL